MNIYMLIVFKECWKRENIGFLVFRVDVIVSLIAGYGIVGDYLTFVNFNVFVCKMGSVIIFFLEVCCAEEVRWFMINGSVVVLFGV